LDPVATQMSKAAAQGLSLPRSVMLVLDLQLIQRSGWDLLT